MLKMFSIKGFGAFLGVIFINAFVDLGHKIIIQNTVLKVYDGQQQMMLTAIVNALILIPFVILFTPSGYLSDHFKKPKVMQISAFIAIIITLCITASYYLGWFKAAFGLTLILAIQSAFYSPSKYGYIAEISAKKDLSMANALVQMITIIAILSSIFFFSILFETFLNQTKNLSPTEILTHIAPLGWILVILSIIEWRLTQKLPILAVKTAKKPFYLKEYMSGQYLKKNLKTMFSHQAIWLSIIGLAIFWSISQVVIAAFPAYVKAALNTDNTMLIQGILASTGIGIVTGSILAGKLSKHYIETGLIPLGALGLATSVLFLPHLTNVFEMIICCVLFGISGGLFIVPLNTLVQFHAKDEQRGMILAGNNWIQNIAMLLFLSLTVAFAYVDFQPTTILHFIGAVTVIGTIYTLYQLPRSLIRYLTTILFSSRYWILAKGLKHIPSKGGVLFLGNHISWLDWAILQIASPRPIRFVMHRDIYKKWYLKPIFDFFKVIPIAGGQSRKALLEIGERLRNGEVVCLFPEGAISQKNELAEFKRGYELATKKLNEGEAIIIPFYLNGLWGSIFSRSKKHFKESQQGGIRRKVVVNFGAPLSIKTKTAELKPKVFELAINTK